MEREGGKGGGGGRGGPHPPARPAVCTHRLQPVVARGGPPVTETVKPKTQGSLWSVTTSAELTHNSNTVVRQFTAGAAAWEQNVS